MYQSAYIYTSDIINTARTPGACWPLSGTLPDSSFLRTGAPARIEVSDMEMEYTAMEVSAGEKAVPMGVSGPMGPGGGDGAKWQKEILWVVVTEGVIRKSDLIARFQEKGEEDIRPVIEGMIANGFFEEIGGFIRIHPHFPENCYAIIRS